MSIFSSKKSKNREIDADRSKQRASTGNGVKAQPNGQGPRYGAANAISNAALSAGARTIQRAQIMAASRKRMDSDTPDYSIQGTTKSKGDGPRASMPNSISVNAARQAAAGNKSSGGVEPKSRSANGPQKLSKAPPQIFDEKKQRSSSMNNVAQSGTATPIYAALQTSDLSLSSPKPKEAMASDNDGNATIPFPKTLPQPLDSPTLGYDGFSKPQPLSSLGPDAAAFSANASPQIHPMATTATQDVRADRISRNDSGVDSKPSTAGAPSFRSTVSKTSVNGEKQTTANVPPGLRAESKASNSSSRSSTYISKLDPGPTGSPFAEPVESPDSVPGQDSSEMADKRPRQTSRPQKFQLDNTPQPKTKTGIAAAVVPQVYGTSKSKEPSSSGLNRLVAASQASSASQSHSSAPQPRKEEKPFAQSPRSPTPTSTASRGFESGREATTRTYTLPSSPPAVVESSRTYTLPASPSAEAGAFRTAPTSTSNTPPRSRDSKDRGRRSKSSADKAPTTDPPSSKPAVAQEPQPSAVTNPALPQFATTRASISERPAMPPISILEGFKVNKRGHVLDEEGEVIGELFEGDLIDCVRQKVDANGDVLDESGVPVGRVRTIVKGTIMAPRWSISSGTSLPLSTYNWGRRDSTASQQTHQTHQTHQTQQSHPTYFNRASISTAAPPPVEGNSIIAELDASNEAEAGPMMDHSEIFSPFGMPKRPDSASTVASVSELAADEKRESSSSKPEEKQESRSESVPAEDFPKPTRKWTSRYFESSPIEGQQSSRRNSASAAVVQSPTTITGAKSPTSIYGAVSPTRSRVVIGPTLESLMEQEPSLFPSSSTPNLLSQASKSGASSPRSTTSGFGAPAPGLAGSRLSVKAPFAHTPARRSPLGNFETTPPGTSEDDRTRSRSVPGQRPKYSTKASKASLEAEDAAPAPEISKRKWQEKRALLSVADIEKTVEKRKSRFSFMLGK